MSRTDIAKTRKRKHLAVFLCIIAVILACFCLGFGENNLVAVCLGGFVVLCFFFCVHVVRVLRVVARSKGECAEEREKKNFLHNE